MMFDLILDVMNGFWQLRDAHTESATTLLPLKLCSCRKDRFNRPAGTGYFLMIPGTSCLATIALSLRDKNHSPIEAPRIILVLGILTLQPKQRAIIAFAIPVDMLNFTAMDNQRIVESGEFEIMIGASSNDIKLRGRIEVVGKNRVLGKVWRMESWANVKLVG
jgi:hypothetical protein